jgi:hypothetical protein
MGLGSEAPSALNLELPGAVHVTSLWLRPGVSSISNCDPSRKACRESVAPSLLGMPNALQFPSPSWENTSNPSSDIFGSYQSVKKSRRLQ